MANSAFGASALRYGADGSAISAFGKSALESVAAGPNTALGFDALASVTTGTDNTALGHAAGSTVVTGSSNTFVGAFSAVASGGAAITGSTAIGYAATVGADNVMALGGDIASTTVDVGIGTPAPNTALQVMGDVRIGAALLSPGCIRDYRGSVIAGACSSDGRLKTNVRPFPAVLDKLAQLRPVHFAWRVDQFPDYHFGSATETGLIAQDVERVFPEMVATDARGFKMVNYSELPLLTLASHRELKARADALDVRVDELSMQAKRLEDLLQQVIRVPIP